MTNGNPKHRRAKQRDALLQMPDEELISTVDVAAILGVSPPTVRNYKQLGIIEPQEVMGHGDAYLVGEIKWTATRLRQLRRAQYTLRYCGRIIQQERRGKRDGEKRR